MHTKTNDNNNHRAGMPQKIHEQPTFGFVQHAIWDTPLLSDISACYRLIGVDRKSQLLSLLLWFEVNEETGEIDLDEPVVYRCDNVDFLDKPASIITEVSLGKFCAGTCKLTAAAELLRDKRYADDIADSIRSMLLDKNDDKRIFLAIGKDLIKACKEFGFAIKLEA